MRFEKDMIFFIFKDVYDKMEKCVDKAKPYEACGLIFGEINQVINPDREEDYFYHYIAKSFKCIESSHKSPVAFLMDDEEELKEISDVIAQEYNQKLISIFHSHPAGSYPSGVDDHYMKMLYNVGIPKFKHIIWTIMDASNKELNGFVYLFNELIRILVEINK